tara:strand:- start:2239 stop:2646 length:408 start_codon:yes stop_codon:yes gene_type:complete
MTGRDYIAVLHKEKDSDYGVSFPDFPGCVTAGKSLDEAKDMAIEALALHIEGLLEDGEAVPEPSGLDAVAAHPDFQGGTAFLVEYKQPVKTVRFNVTADSRDLDLIDKFAEKHGYTRSGFLVAAAKKQIEEGRAA